MHKSILKPLLLGALAVLTAAPAMAQVRAELGQLHIRIATDAPPRARHERRPTRPHRDALWINGYWDRQDDRWDWVSGRWEQRRHCRARWINARYRREGRAWRYEPAHWSDQQLIEGEDYQRWRQEQRAGRGRH